MDITCERNHPRSRTRQSDVYSIRFLRSHLGPAQENAGFLFNLRWTLSTSSQRNNGRKYYNIQFGHHRLRRNWKAIPYKQSNLFSTNLEWRVSVWSGRHSYSRSHRKPYAKPNHRKSHAKSNRTPTFSSSIVLGQWVLLAGD